MSTSSLKKANSPVKKTGQTSGLKKRLLKTKQKELLLGREKILMAARECFAKRGFSGTSIKDIQQASGFSRGNLYHHFKTKEEIVHIIITQNLGRFCDRIEAILTKTDSEQLAFKDVLKELAAFAEEITKGPGKGMAFHVWSLSVVDSDIKNTVLIYFDRICSALEKQVVLQQSKGIIAKNKNSKELAKALFGIVVPGFTVQSVLMDQASINANTYIDCLSVLLKD